MSFSICRQLGLMSISCAVQRTDAISRLAWSSVRVVVAKPGIV